MFKGLHARSADAIITVDAVADLPANAEEGDIRYAKDTDLLYTFNGSTWTPAASGVSGPGSSTDNGIARFDGTDGTTIKSSTVTIDDSGNIEGAGTISSGEITSSSLTADRALISGAGKEIESSTVTATELGYVSGVSGAIQTQLNGKQPLDATLTALAAYNTNGLLTQTAADTFAGRTLTAGSSKISISDGNGVAGNPTIDLGTVTTADIPEDTNLYFTDERAQDAVGPIFENTATVEFTYTDATPSITADVLEAGLTLSNLGGTLSIAKGGTGQTAATAAFDALAPSGTKGDLLVYGDSSATVALGVGGNTTILTADSSTPSGVKWAAPASVDLTSGVTGILPLANGGTNKNMSPEAGGLVYTDSNSMEVTSAGTASQWALSGGTGAPTFSDTTTRAKAVQQSGLTLTLGADSGGIATVSNNTNKQTTVVMPHYASGSASPFTLFNATSISGPNELSIGGGTASGNAATNVSIYTAANQTSGAGTARLAITSSAITLSLPTTVSSTLQATGDVNFGGAAASAPTSVALNIAGDSATATSLAIAAGNAASGISLLRAAGTIGSPTVVSSADIIGSITGIGYDGNSYEDAAKIEFVVDGTPGNGDMPGRIVMYTTADGSATPTERLRIDNAGNVVIPTNDALLRVGGTAQGGLRGTNSGQDLDVGGGSNRLRFFTNGWTTNVGTISTAGGWTLGLSANITHLIQNNTTTGGNYTLSVVNLDTSTSSNGIAPLYVRKGSTTNTAGVNQFIRFDINAGGTGSGYIGSSGTDAANFFSTSDRRLKTEIVDLPSALESLLQLRPVQFKWKQNGDTGVSFVAQELATVFPQFVHQTDSGEGETLPQGTQPWAMTEGGFVPYLVKAIQELEARISVLEAT